MTCAGWRVTRQYALPAYGDRSSALPGTSHSRVRRRGLGSSSRCWCRPRPEQLVDGDELTKEVIDCFRHQEIHGHISFGCGFEKTRVQRFTQPDGSRHSWFLVTGSPCHGTHHMRCSRASGGCRARQLAQHCTCLETAPAIRLVAPDLQVLRDPRPGPIGLLTWPNRP